MRLRKLLASILAFCMILSTMGTAVFAEEIPADETAVAIDYDATAEAALTEAEATAVSDNNLYVSTDYNSETEGYGVTKFSNYSAAYSYATANNTSATIVIEKNSSISGFCFDNNHKNYTKLAVVIKDGATMGVSLSKWDMTYPVTVEAGGTLTCARPKNSSVSNIHIKNKLIIGTAGSNKQAYCYLLSDDYQDCDISIRYNGSITVHNAVMEVQDLDAQGSFTATNSNIKVDGAFASATFYATTLTDSTMQINGNQISGGLSDFSGGENNQLGKVTLNGDSSIAFAEGSAVDVAATVTVNGNSSITADTLTIAKSKKLNANGTSSVSAQTLTNNGTIAAVSGTTVTATTVSGASTGVATIDGAKAEFDERGRLVLSPVTVATVNGVGYQTLQAAFDAAAAATGEVTVEILTDIDLTNVDWNPVTVSAPKYPVVTVNGNNKTITGLNDMLFAGTWAGGSGLIINDLTIKDSNIVNDENDSKGNVGVGAFIGFPQASATVTLNNCHLVDSKVSGGHWTGGLIGYAAGYAGNDGPVFMNLTITDCSVTGSTITGKGSAGGIVGHGSGNGWTNVVIENTTVSNNTITSTGTSTNKAGAVMGTIGAAGQPTTANGVTKTGGASIDATVSKNNVTSAGTTITTIYGRQGTTTGMLYVTGGTYEHYPIEEGVSYAAPADGFVIEQNEDGTYGVVEAKLSGTGSEEDPYLINDIDDLKLFRDFVNAGNDYKGKFIKLTADIDLENNAWTPIGTDVAPFKGNFDGGSKTIKNLKVEGEGNQGFFGYATDAKINNLNLNNVDVKGTDCVGAVLGQGYASTYIDNCHVSGSVKVEGLTNVGGIVGKYYARVTNSSVVGDAASTSYVKGVYSAADLEGDNVGGIMGHAGENNTHSGNIVKNITVSGTRKIGGLIGTTDRATDLSGCTVENVVIESTATAEYADANSNTATIGGLVGNYYGDNVGGTITDCAVTSVAFNKGNAKNVGAVVGGVRVAPEATEVEGVTASNIVVTDVTGTTNYYFVAQPVAKIGDVEYTDLQKAIGAAEDGETITLLSDIELGETLTNNKKITLDLNGHTMTYNSTVQGEAMITNKGDLTINDSVGTGVINYNYTGAADPSYGKGNYTISNGGKLTVNGGKITIANLRQHAKYPIDNNSTSGDAILVINGGHLYNYNTSAIRQFCNSTTNQNSVTINGGTIEGYCAIWVQNPGKKTVNGALSITGGEIKTTAAAYVNGTSALKDVSSRIYCTIDGEGGAWSETSSVSITGGTINENVNLEANAPADVTIGENATFNGYVKTAVSTVVLAQTKNANGDIVGEYADFESALAAACADASVARIEILGDITQVPQNIGVTYNVAEGQNLTIGVPEGAEYTIDIDRSATTEGATKTFSIYLRNANSSLTIGEGLTMKGLDILADGFATNNNELIIDGTLYALSLKEWTSGNGITINETGKVVLGYGDGQFDLAYGNGYVTINGDGSKTEPQFKAGYSGTRGNGNTLNLNDTYFEGGAWFKVNGSNGTFNIDNSIMEVSGGRGDLTIASTGNVFNLTNGSELKVNKLTLGENNELCIDGTSQVIVTTLTGNGKITIDAANLTAGATPIVGNASGFAGSIEVVNNSQLKAEIDENGNIVLVIPAVAKIGDVKYTTLADAFAAAQDGDTVVLLEDAVLDASVTITKSITIDGAGHKITQSDVCNNEWALLYFDATEVLDITIKNVTFDGVKGGAAVRTLGANITIDNCVFQNCEHTQVQGLLRLTQGSAIVKDSKFLKNTCSMVISYNYDTAGLAGDTFLVDNCVFEGNTANATALIYYVKGEGCTIKNSEFKDNTVNCENNGATIYLGFQEDCVVTGNLFENNSVTDSTSSTRVAGAIFFGYEAEISGNAFINNTASNASGDALGQICTSTYYDCAIDLSGNYWGGEAPVYGKDYTVQHQTGDATFALETYHSSYAMDVNGNVVMGAEVAISNVAQVGKFGYATLQSAINAAQDGDTVKLIGDVEMTSSATISGKTLTLDLGEYTIYDKSTTVLTSEDGVWGLIELKDNANLTVCGDGAIECNYADTRNGWTGMAYCINVDNTSELTVNSGSFKNSNGGIQTAGKVTVNNGTFVSHNGGTCIMATYSDANVTVNDGIFKDSVEESDVYTGSGAVWGGFGATINIKGGTYDFAADPEHDNIVWTLFPAQNAIAGYGENANMTVTGGTFVNFNPATDVIVDYSASAGFTYGSVVAEGHASIENLSGNYVVGVKPTATVNNLGDMTIPAGDYMVYGNGDNTEDMPLSFVMQFLADQDEEDMKTSPYADWYGDFVITFTGIENESFVADGCYLAGHYGTFGWVKVPVDGMEIEEGVRYPVMLGVGMGQKYTYICSDVEDFKCALYLPQEIIDANPNLKVNLELSVVDNSKGEDAAKEALIKNETIYKVNDIEYTAEDFAIVTPVAKIGDVEYASLKEAFEAVQDSETITLLADIELDEMLVNSKKITLDLNGKTITGTDNTEKNFSLIDNRGELIITGNGTMTLTATVNSGWGRYSAVLANNPGGKLVVENGTIEHLGGTDMAYGIDNLTNGKGTYAETIINGGTVKSTYRAVRQFLNGVEAENILTINGGTIEGANKSIFFHDPSAQANTGTLTVNEGAVVKGDVYLFVTEYSTEWPVEVSIAKSALVDSEVTSKNVPSGYEIVEENGVIGVETVTYVAQIGEVKYASLAEAFAAAKADGVVTLIDDVSLVEGLTVAKDAVITLDLNGKTIARDTDEANSTATITNYGTLTVKDSGENGKITAFAANPDTADVPYYANNTITNCGILNIEGGTIENSTGDNARAAFPIDNNSTSNDAIVNITGGTVTGRGAIRQFANSTSKKNEVNIEGGTVSGTSYGVWVQNPGSKDPVASLNISKEADVAKVLISPSAEFDIAISGGTVADVAIWDADETNENRNPSAFITGGTFKADVSDYLAEGYTLVDNNDGTYGVVVAQAKDMLGKLLAVWEMSIKTDANGVKYYPIHIYAGIDSLKYKEVGFKVTVTNTDEQKSIDLIYPTTVVYRSMRVTLFNGSVELYKANALGEDCAYMFGTELQFGVGNGWTDENTKIEVTPYAIDLKGNEILGVTKVITNEVAQEQMPGTTLFKEE